MVLNQKSNAAKSPQSKESSEDRKGSEDPLFVGLDFRLIDADGVLDLGKSILDLSYNLHATIVNKYFNKKM
jgi:hypothetical protein